MFIILVNIFILFFFSTGTSVPRPYLQLLVYYTSTLPKLAGGMEMENQEIPRYRLPYIQTGQPRASSRSRQLELLREDNKATNVEQQCNANVISSIKQSFPASVSRHLRPASPGCMHRLPNPGTSTPGDVVRNARSRSRAAHRSGHPS